MFFVHFPLAFLSLLLSSRARISEVLRVAEWVWGKGGGFKGSG